MSAADLTGERADRIAELVMAGIIRRYPHVSVRVAHADADSVPHHRLHPIFDGCFDWHSAVHSHWTLARLVRLCPERGFAEPAHALLVDRLTADKARIERASFDRQRSFELPYGLAWLLTLDSELAAHGQPWRAALEPLALMARERLVSWLRRLPMPVRSGQHDQSAFSMTLCLRWARSSGDGAWAAEISDRALAWYGGDRNAALGFEPSAHDFLSPNLSVAELMSLILPADELAVWLTDFAPALGAAWPPSPVVSADRSDGKLAHFDGLNLSRAWMLRAIAGALPESDPRRAFLWRSAEDHGERGLGALDSNEFAVTHWVPTFATYWLTEAA